MSTFRYDVLKSNLNEKEFKNLLIEFYKSKNVNRIVFLNADGSQEVLLESVSNYAKKGNNDELMREDVYLFDNKKNYRRGGCRPKSGWICEIRVNKSDTVFV